MAHQLYQSECKWRRLSAFSSGEIDFHKLRLVSLPYHVSYKHGSVSRYSYIFNIGFAHIGPIPRVDFGINLRTMHYVYIALTVISRLVMLLTKITTLQSRAMSLYGIYGNGFGNSRKSDNTQSMAILKLCFAPCSSLLPVTRKSGPSSIDQLRTIMPYKRELAGWLATVLSDSLSTYWRHQQASLECSCLLQTDVRAATPTGNCSVANLSAYCTE